jgi:molecular chaperone GrpE
MADEEILDQNDVETPEQQSATEAETVDVEHSAEELAAKLEEAEKKAADNWEQLLRTKAEMDNLRRRTQKDLENAHKFALEKFVSELLPVLDSMALGLDAAKQENSTVESLQQGTELTMNMLKQVFEKFNVAEVDPQGEKFNPDHHQAMSMQENHELEPNTVMAVMQKGYLLNDRLVRPAMVMVSKAPATTDEEK